MLNFGTIYKKRLKTIDGVDTLDLTESTLNTRLQVTVDSVITVSKPFAGRPTAIALAIYGSENYADLLFAFNGYSDMLRVNEGDILVIPRLDSMLSCLTTPEDVNTVDAKAATRNEDNYTATEFKKKIINRDINRLKVIAQNTGIDIKDLDIRKPNAASTSFFELDGNDGVILGTNVSEKKCMTLSAVQTKSELLRDAVKQRLISEFSNNTQAYAGKISYDDKNIKLT